MNRRWIFLLIVIVVITVGGTLITNAADPVRPEPDVHPQDAASEAVQAYFDAYLKPDGHVDAVAGVVTGDGQAAALLLAAATSDSVRFASIWQWTSTNLRNDRGLFVKQWQDGAVSDVHFSARTNMDIARALVVAGRVFALNAATATTASDYTQAAKQLAGVLASHIADVAGTQVLLGDADSPLDFALAADAPRTDNELFALTGDERWNQLATSQRMLRSSLGGSIKDPRLLPARAAIDDSGKPSPGGATTTDSRYNGEAFLTPVRLAESCDATDKAEAEQMWVMLSRSPQTRAATDLTLDGEVVVEMKSAPSAVASSAGVMATGDTYTTSQMLDFAQQIHNALPSFDGAQAVALGRVMLTTDWLGHC